MGWVATETRSSRDRQDGRAIGGRRSAAIANAGRRHRKTLPSEPTPQAVRGLLGQTIALPSQTQSPTGLRPPKMSPLRSPRLAIVTPAISQYPLSELRL